MLDFFQIVFSGLALGGIYALIALGFVVVFRASGVLNFAHGEIMIVGAFLMTTILAMGVPWYLAFVIVAVAIGLFGAAIERVVLRPMVGKSVLSTMILTMLVGIVIHIGVAMFWGHSARGMPTPWDANGRFVVWGLNLPYNSVAAIVIALVALLAFFFIMQRSKIGLGMRTVALDQEVALAMGVPVGRLLGFAWFLAGVLAAVAGILLAMPPRNVDLSLATIALLAFPALLLGGIDSPLGAIVGGLTLGVIQVLTQGYLNVALGDFGQNFHTVVPYVIMILVLMVRPEGLFGTKEVERI